MAVIPAILGAAAANPAANAFTALSKTCGGGTSRHTTAGLTRPGPGGVRGAGGGSAAAGALGMSNDRGPRVLAA